MSPYVGKLAPLAVVLAVAVYCTVSGVMGSAAKEKAKPAAATPEFTAAHLTPKFPSFPERDPFQMPKNDSPAVAQS